MSLAILRSRASTGIHAPEVSVEVHISNGLPSFSIVGLPEATVKESKDRVRSSLLNSLFEFPIRRFTVNLAPADLPKEGGRFDLPIAVGIAAATKQMRLNELQDYELAGELALSGEIRGIRGALPFAMAAKRAKRTLIIPAENAEEAALSGYSQIIAANHLLEVIAHFNQQKKLEYFIFTPPAIMTKYEPDMADVKGQSHAKRALEIAAAGGHSMLMFGPPGTGKSMLASRLPSILPELTEQEALELAAVTSISKRHFDWQQWRKRPFRAPHHSASSVALVGGGSPPKPGEISLAHHGVLFLDELPEFDKKVLEALREPLEAGNITISRAAMQAEFPARFQLIAAMNPCPCGYKDDGSGRCHCNPEQIKRYRAKISGPLLDRIDMHVEVSRLPEGMFTQINKEKQGESSEIIRQRIQKCRALQISKRKQINSQLSPQNILEICRLQESEQDYLDKVTKQWNLSGRAIHRILRLARTIADMEASEILQKQHLAEALSYRKWDRRVEV